MNQGGALQLSTKCQLGICILGLASKIIMLFRLIRKNFNHLICIVISIEE